MNISLASLEDAVRAYGPRYELGRDHQGGIHLRYNGRFCICGMKGSEVYTFNGAVEESQICPRCFPPRWVDEARQSSEAKQAAAKKWERKYGKGSNQSKNDGCRQIPVNPSESSSTGSPDRFQSLVPLSPEGVVY